MRQKESPETADTTFPAKGILKGSVQNIPRRARAINDVLTAMDNSIGNSGGITEVMIIEQPSKSLYLLLVGSSRPCKGVSSSLVQIHEFI